MTAQNGVKPTAVDRKSFSEWQSWVPARSKGSCDDAEDDVKTGTKDSEYPVLEEANQYPHSGDSCHRTVLVGDSGRGGVSRRKTPVSAVVLDKA